MTVLLVFFAVAALGFVAASTLEAAVAEKTSSEESAAAASENGVDAFPYAAFTTRRRLAHIRLVSGYAGFVVCCFVLSSCGAALPVALGLAVVAAVASSSLPTAILKRRRRKRLEAAAAQVLDLATGLAGGLRSGQALPAALESVSGRIQKPLAEEVAVVLREYRLGLDLPDALARLAERVPSEDITLLVGSIRLTQQAGGSLAEVLDKMVEMIRARTEFQAKLKTMTAQGRFEAVAMSLAPFAVFLLLFAIDRPLVLPLVSTPVGWTTLALDALWVGIGFLVIDRIVTIEV